MIHVAVVTPAAALRAGLAALLNNAAVQVMVEAASLDDLQPLPAGIDVLVLAGSGTGVPAAARLALPDDVPLALLFLVSGEETFLPDVSGLPLRAWGVLPLEASAEELQAAVAALAQGLVVGSPALLGTELLRLLSGGASDLTSMADPAAEALTGRETEVLSLLAQGLANKQIALRLGISEHTVKFHVSAVYAKLGANSRTEAVRLGVRQGMISL